MRLGDFLDLKLKDWILGADFIKINLPKSKTDQLREGAIKVIAKAPNPKLCPVNLLKLWVTVMNIKSSMSPIFPMLTCAQKSISVTSFRERLARALEGSSLPKITPNSFRAGFAINQGASTAELKEFRLWESEASIQRYTKRSDSKKAETSTYAWNVTSNSATVSDSCPTSLWSLLVPDVSFGLFFGP